MALFLLINCLIKNYSTQQQPVVKFTHKTTAELEKERDANLNTATEELRKTFGATGAAFFFDYDPNRNVRFPTPFPKGTLQKQLSLFATLMRRRLIVENPSCYVLASLKPQDQGSGSNAMNVLDAIEALSDSALAKFAIGQLPLSGFQGADLGLISGKLAFMSTFPDITDRIVNEPDAVGVRLYPSLLVHISDPSSGFEGGIPVNEPWLPSASLGNNGGPIFVPMGAKKGMTKTESIASSSGPLDFGKGVFLPLSEIVTAANNEFHKSFYLDDRMSSSLCFIAGKYSFSSFSKAIVDVTTTYPSIPTKHRDIGQPMAEFYQKRLSHTLLKDMQSTLANYGIDVSSVFGGSAISYDQANALLKDSPLWAEYGAGHPGLVITLAPALTVVADAGPGNIIEPPAGSNLPHTNMREGGMVSFILY